MVSPHLVALLALVTAYKVPGMPLRWTASGTAGQATGADYHTTLDKEYRCQTKVPFAQASKETAKDCETYDSKQTFKHTFREKSNTDKCCTDRDLQLKQNPDFCGLNGELKCYGGQIQSICECKFGWTGATCNETNYKQVNCKCVDKTTPLASEIKYENCDKQHNQSRCIKRIANDICICDLIGSESNNNLPECMFESNDSEVDKNQTELLQTTSDSKGVAAESSGSSGAHVSDSHPLPVAWIVIAIVAVVGVLIAFPIIREKVVQRNGRSSQQNEENHRFISEAVPNNTRDSLELASISEKLGQGPT